MFAGISGAFLRPGQELRNFNVVRAGSHKTESGRILRNDFEIIGTVSAILAAARPEERERWRLLNHSVTHKIILQGVTPFEVNPGDVFEYGERCFLVRADPYNVGDVNHWTIYYCEERGDL